MILVDFLFNLAALLVWLCNRLRAATGPTSGFRYTLKKAHTEGGARAWLEVSALPAILCLHALVSWQIGTATNWVPTLNFGIVTVPCRPDFPLRLLLHSVMSFAGFIGVFYLWLLFLILLNRNAPGNDAWQRLILNHLSWVSAWPPLVLAVVPFFAMTLFWFIASHGFLAIEMIPKPDSGSHRFQQAMLLGVYGYLYGRYLAAIILLLHVFNSYVYLGSHPFWNFIRLTAHNLQKPFQRIPLRQVGRIDFTPVIAMATVLLIAEFAERGLIRVFSGLPL